MTLKLRVGRKGYIILPKAIREAVGISEGDEVVVEVKDGILLKPVGKIDTEKLKDALERHAELVKSLPNTIEPKPGDLAKIYLEEEFEG